MKPLIALILFFASATLFYFQPLPDPADHLPAVHSQKHIVPVSSYDLEIDYVTDPDQVNIP